MIAKRGLAGLWIRIVINFLRMKEQCMEEIAVSEIGEKYGVFRIVDSPDGCGYGQIDPEVRADLAGGLCERGRQIRAD